MFIKNSHFEINKKYAIRLEEVYFRQNLEHPSQRIHGSHLIFDMRQIENVYVAKGDLEDHNERNPGRWEIQLKSGEKISFYPFFNTDAEGTFLSNQWSLYTSLKQRYKAFRYLFSKLSKNDKDFLLEFYDVRMAMTDPSFFATEFEPEE
jgi:hypothetical protein